MFDVCVCVFVCPCDRVCTILQPNKRQRVQNHQLAYHWLYKIIKTKSHSSQNNQAAEQYFCLQKTKQPNIRPISSACTHLEVVLNKMPSAKLLLNDIKVRSKNLKKPHTKERKKDRRKKQNYGIARKRFKFIRKFMNLSI